jgi:hypothetical protein
MVLCNRMHWTNHPKYDPRKQLSNGVNPSVPYPAGGDQLAWDATRHGKSAIADLTIDPLAIRESSDGSFDPVLLCHVIRIEPWMLLDNLGAGAGSIHAHWSPRSPFTIMWGAGKMWVVARTTTTPIVGNAQPPEHVAGTIEIRPEDVGTYWAVIHSVGIDPKHGYLRTWVRRGRNPNWLPAANETGLGYTYAPGDPRSGLFYLRLASMTIWHNDQKRAPNNWAGPDVRDTRYAWSGGIIRPTIGVDAVKAHADAILDGPTSPPPPPPPPPPSDEVANLWAEVAQLTALVNKLANSIGDLADVTAGHGQALDRLERRWEALARIASGADDG